MRFSCTFLTLILFALFVPAGCTSGASLSRESSKPQKEVAPQKPPVVIEAYAFFMEAVSCEEESERMLLALVDPRRRQEVGGLTTGEIISGSRELWEKAVRLYEKVLEIDPRCFAAHKRLALGFLERREVEKGISHLKEAAALNPSDYLPHYILADWYERKGRNDDAISELHLALKGEGSRRKTLDAPRMLLRLGRLYRKVGKPNRAIATYYDFLKTIKGAPDLYRRDSILAALAEDPSPVYQSIAEIYIEMKQYGPALKVLREALEIAPSSLSLKSDLARAYLKSGDIAKAIEECKRALKENPREIRFHRTLYEAYEASGEIERAIQECGAYIAAEGEIPQLQFILGGLYEKAGRKKEAKEVYQRLASPEVKFAPAYFALVRLLREEKNYAEALLLLARAIDDGFETPKLYEKSEEILESARSEGKGDELLKQLLDRSPQDEQSPGYHFLVGRTALFLTEGPPKEGGPELSPEASKALSVEEKKYLSLAIENLEQARRLKSDFLLTYIYASVAYSRLEDFDRAISTIDEAIALRPASFLYRQKAYILMDAKRYKEAAEVLIIATKLPSLSTDEYLDLRYDLAMVYEKLKEPEKAMNELKEILAISPDHAPANNALGYFYAERGENLEEAIELIERALAKEPGNGAYIDSLGWVYFKQGKFKKALEKLKEASEKLVDPIILEHLGDAYWKLGKKKEARDAWRRALSLDPESESLKERLEK